VAGPKARLFPELAGSTWNLWVSHDKVRKGEWFPLLRGISRKRAVDEMTMRQDIVRRNKQPCRFRALIEGEKP
jgi:hypothetical protein